MKKRIVCVFVMLCLLGCIGCGTNPKENMIAVDYGSSAIYTHADIDAAIMVILLEFDTWEGCRMHSLSYGSDDACSPENLAWMNDLASANQQDGDFTQVILFKSNFHSPKHGGGAWNADYEYTDWEWWLARTTDGEWKLLTWGY